MTVGNTLVKAAAVSVTLQGKQVLDHVDLTVRAGEILAMIGPNGAGKTTLVRVILGLLQPQQGEVIISPGVRIGYMPQRMVVDAILPLTVRRFLTLGSRCSEPALQQVMDEVGVLALLESPVQNISGGELQRVMLARALLRKPDLLVLDEPVQGVDITGQTELFKLISKIRDHHGCGILMVSHDLHLVMANTDRVLCLNHHVCCSGHPTEVSSDPSYLELFGLHPGLALYTHNHDHCHGLHGRVEDATQETTDHG
ncbi:Zinc ABC transporter, ATP-binding protein ZnuC [hydrothermal vent metagenome]|uniref:Zinc ABC transporter, ATP-binding protein ZnuC n=1 Tax=hydrothermal vent metagenome TaxID=652676 RepID=A0A3B1B1S1_9ZZZZ